MPSLSTYSAELDYAYAPDLKTATSTQSWTAILTVSSQHI